MVQQRYCTIICYGSNSFLCHVMFNPREHKDTETPPVFFPGEEFHTPFWATLLDLPVSTFPIPALCNTGSQKKPTNSTKASLSHYPTLSRHFSCISDQVCTSLIPSNSDTGQGLLAETGWTVSVKWEQCFLRNQFDKWGLMDDPDDL